VPFVVAQAPTEIQGQDNRFGLDIGHTGPKCPLALAHLVVR